MSSKTDSQDMSVEEILRSIKGVITGRAGMTQDHEDEVLELTEIVPDQGAENIKDEEELISKKSTLEAKSTLKKFLNTAKTAATATSNSKNVKKDIIKEWVVEMIRPSLRQWLDSNLPSIVRELVEKELKKLMPNNTD